MCVVGQPAQRPAPQFMAAPAAIPGIPPGLEYLAQIDQLLVHQQIELFECTYTCHQFNSSHCEPSSDCDLSLTGTRRSLNLNLNVVGFPQFFANPKSNGFFRLTSDSDSTFVLANLLPSFVAVYH